MRDPPERRLNRSSADDDDAEPLTAYPPRYWWLRRLAAGLVSLAVVLSVTRVVWGWEAERRLRHALGEIAARGEPVRPADFVTESVPDAENAATLLIRAAAAVDPNADCPSSSGTPFDPYPPTRPCGSRRPTRQSRRARKHLCWRGPRGRWSARLGRRRPMLRPVRRSSRM